MRALTFHTLPLAVAFYSTFLLWEVNGVSLGFIKFGGDKVFDNEYQNVDSNIYNLITRVTAKKDKCTQHVTVTGKGIGDVFDLPCRTGGIVTSLTDTILIYGNPKEDGFALYSDEPSALVVFQDGKCNKRTYQTKKNRKTTGVVSKLSGDECNIIRQKINFIEDVRSKYLVALNKPKEEKPKPNPPKGVKPPTNSYKSVTASQDNVKQGSSEKTPQAPKPPTEVTSNTGPSSESGKKYSSPVTQRKTSLSLLKLYLPPKSSDQTSNSYRFSH